jgi:hypothetical protein
MAKFPRQQDTPFDAGLFRKNHSGKRQKTREKCAIERDERLYCPHQSSTGDYGE